MNRICRPGFGQEPSAKCIMQISHFYNPSSGPSSGCKNAGDFVKEHFSFVLDILVFWKP